MPDVALSTRLRMVKADLHLRVVGGNTSLTRDQPNLLRLGCVTPERRQIGRQVVALMEAHRSTGHERRQCDAHRSMRLHHSVPPAEANRHSSRQL